MPNSPIVIITPKKSLNVFLGAAVFLTYQRKEEDMAFKYQKLRARIIEKYGTQGKFAEALGTSENTVSRKMNDSVSFSREDILKWAELLSIPSDSIGEYFFA